ncbi:MAG: GGDEF domain-containing protein [Lysobacteraceae bacterium]|nr:MAG: GGDEF domain-containing protein [Xanthomonadaceae bacterium]
MTMPTHRAAAFRRTVIPTPLTVRGHYAPAATFLTAYERPATVRSGAAEGTGGGMRLRFGWWRIAGALIAAILCAQVQAREPAELLSGVSDTSLTPYMRFRHDKAADDSVDDAWRRVAAGQFAPVPSGKTAFGFQRGAFWFHAEVVNHNPDERHWMLVQSFALIDSIDVYIRYPDGRIVHQASGDHVPFDSRSIPYRHPNFRIELPPGQRVQLLIRTQSKSSMQVPLALYTPAAFTSLSRDAQFVMGLYYGILLALFFYNLVLWLTLRDASYFWYLFHITAFGLVLFTLNGYSFEYIWPHNPWLANVAVPLSICLAIVGMQQFARTFLELPKRFPLGNLVSIVFIVFCTGLGLASLRLPYDIATPLATRAVIVSVLWTVTAAVVVLRRGYRPARLFLAAWAVFLTGAAAIAALAFGIVPKNLMTEYGVQIGSALEMLLLSIALSYRYASLRNENERIAMEAHQQLERKVAQRTQELRSALTQLEDAHRRLHDSSRRDGLTGLYNRTHFHESFEKHLASANTNGTPVSLLMIDLDHFKSINDKYGHLTGDDCLRWAAHRIGQALRVHESSLLARFGGEEFVVVLPGHDLHAAVNVAEALRRKLVEEPCPSGEHRLRVSASIGVHTIESGAGVDSDTALSVADQALYSAKANGRDCVRTSITAA